MDDFASLVLRLVSRGLVIAHDAQKLFGWFEGCGFKQTHGLVDAFGTSLPACIVEAGWAAAPTMHFFGLRLATYLVTRLLAPAPSGAHLAKPTRPYYIYCYYTSIVFPLTVR